MGEMRLKSGASLPGLNMKPVWIRLPATPARAAAPITVTMAGAAAVKACRITCTAPPFSRSKASGRSI